jgi:two-component system, OmpR family, sensor histidine kinase ChvG
MIIAGLLYHGEYRDNLIESEITALRAHADMFSAALGEGAVGGKTPLDQVLVRETANRIVLRMVESTDTRARLFRFNGQLVADSRSLMHAGRDVEVEVLLPPIEAPAVLHALFGLYDRLVSYLTGRETLKPYVEHPRQHARQYPEVILALQGQAAKAIRTYGRDQLLISVSVPVQRYKKVLGAVLVTKTSKDIDQAMFEVRLNILKIFAVTLAITSLLSLYLAGTIAQPILKLSDAADKIRHSLNRQDRLSELEARDDEIGDLAQSLHDMTDALWDRMDAIERFAADVSHEIKNPLTSLKSAVETAARVTEPEQQQKLLAIIQDDVERLDRLITDISNASRLDAELSRTALTKINVGDMLETLTDIHTSTAKEGAPRIVVEMGTNTACAVSGMEDRLVQVFRNLIANAITFSPTEGLITIALHQDDDGCAIVTVSDEGPGIQPGKETTIFERFYSERPEGEKFGTHSGLGLSISKLIIDAHHGTIAAGNRYATNGAVIGARFTVTLPAITG